MTELFKNHQSVLQPSESIKTDFHPLFGMKNISQNVRSFRQLLTADTETQERLKLLDEFNYITQSAANLQNSRASKNHFVS